MFSSLDARLSPFPLLHLVRVTPQSVKKQETQNKSCKYCEYLQMADASV